MQMGRTLQETILNAQAKISTSQTYDG